MNQVLDDAGTGELLQVQARLTELDANALNAADPESLAHEIIEPDAAHDHLPAGFRAAQADILVRLGLDQGQCPARSRSLLAELAVSLKSLACQCRDGVHPREHLTRPDVDLHDVHASIMAG